ncbi:MAG TPA: thioredoxin family protein [Dongiaceae bacterium]|nr:thioredoxin family protein [Dongiaceae bacterium]
MTSVTPRAPGGGSRTLPRWLWILAIALVIARIGTAMMEQRHPSQVRDMIPWRPSADAETLARQTGRPILYEFSADWCGPCHVLQSEVFGDPQHASIIANSFVPVRVVDRQREDGHNPMDVQTLEEHYHIQAFPTLVVVDPDGGELVRLEGYPGATGVMQQLTSAATKYRLKKGQFGGPGFIVK